MDDNEKEALKRRAEALVGCARKAIENNIPGAKTYAHGAYTLAIEIYEQIGQPHRVRFLGEGADHLESIALMVHPLTQQAFEKEYLL